jgi:hypothetical protein
MKTDHLLRRVKVEKSAARQTSVCCGMNLLAGVPSAGVSFRRNSLDLRRVSGTYRFGLGLEVMGG